MYLHYNSHNRSRKQKVIFHTATLNNQIITLTSLGYYPKRVLQVLLKNSNLPWHFKHLKISPPLLIRCVTYN